MADATILEPALPASPAKPAAYRKLLRNPGVVFDELDAISAANSRGHSMLGAISCCPLSFDFTLESPYPIEGLAAWQPAFPLKGAALRAKLAEPAFGHAEQDIFFLLRIALHRRDQIRDQVGAPLILIQHFRPRFLDRLILGLKVVITAAGKGEDRGHSQQQSPFAHVYSRKMRAIK